MEILAIQVYKILIELNSIPLSLDSTSMHDWSNGY